MANETFDECLFDPFIIGATGSGAGDITGGPELANTDMANPATGVHNVNVSRRDALQRIVIPVYLKDEAARDYFLRFWIGGYGSAYGFRVRVPFDYKVTAQPVGTIASSTTAAFQLVRTRARPGITAREDVRAIVKPVVNSNLASGSATLVEADGVTTRAFSTSPGSTFTTQFAVTVGGSSSGFTYTIHNKTGVLTVTTTTASGIVAVTFEYDTPVAFVGNGIQMRFDVSAEVQNVILREIPPAELGLIV